MGKMIDIHRSVGKRHRNLAGMCPACREFIPWYGFHDDSCPVCRDIMGVKTDECPCSALGPGIAYRRLGRILKKEGIQ